MRNDQAVSVRIYYDNEMFLYINHRLTQILHQY